jgi:hypothetical protein
MYVRPARGSSRLGGRSRAVSPGAALFLVPGLMAGSMLPTGFSGLGASGLTPVQILQTAMAAGFPEPVAVQMTAIALRESAGIPTATNLRAPGTTSATDPGEQSYGLWQINVAGNPGLMAQLGITDPSQLLDPETNARAAYLMYNNNPNNLNVAWYINRPGYQQAYEANLPAAEAAAAAIGDPNVDIPTYDPSAGDASTFPTIATDFSGVTNFIEGMDPMTLGLGAAAIALLVLWFAE